MHIYAVAVGSLRYSRQQLEQGMVKHYACELKQFLLRENAALSEEDVDTFFKEAEVKGGYCL